MSTAPIFRSAVPLVQDDGSGRRPVVFDVLGPDWETSLLPEDMRMVLHVNPTSMAIQHTRLVERLQTRGGFVEQHWGDAPSEVTFENATGGFMRLYAGLSNITNPAYGGTRRETIAYDKYLDMLALYHNTGLVYDTNGSPVFQGILKMTFDGGVYLGWFNNTLTVTEAAEKPYQFTVSATFAVRKEVVSWRTTVLAEGATSAATSEEAYAETPLFGPT